MTTALYKTRRRQFQGHEGCYASERKNKTFGGGLRSRLQVGMRVSAREEKPFFRGSKRALTHTERAQEVSTAYTSWRISTETR
eukprot:scaffold473833_cov51-Prasinocladus_malaysianus.AAC.1